MRCGSCSAENAASRRFCRACGARLPQACPACEAVNEPEDRFCGACGAPLPVAQATASVVPEASASPPDHALSPFEERRLVTVLFADIVGYTALSERLDSETVRDIVTSCLGRLVTQVERYEGIVEKFIGDAVMAVWGAPVAHEDDAERALRAAVGMLEAVDVLNRDLDTAHGDRLALRIGVQSGEVIAGMRDVGGIRAFNVNGDAVNVAARLQGATEPGTILVGEATMARAQALFEFRPVQALVLKNKRDPVRAALLMGARVGPTVMATTLSRAPLIGRADEVATVSERIRELRRGRGQIVLVVGEPGLGKSRLLAELRASEDTNRSGAPVESGVAMPVLAPFRWVRCQAFAHEQGHSYELTRGVLRALLDLGPEQDPIAIARRLEAVRSLPGDAAGVLGHVLGALPGEREVGITDLAPAEFQRVLFQAVGRLLESLASQMPLVVELDDLHWADPSSIDLLLEVVGLTERVPML